MSRSALGPVLVFTLLMAQPLLAHVPLTSASPGPRFVPPGTAVLFDEAHFPVYTVNPNNPSGYRSGNEPRGAYAAYASVLSQAGFTVKTLDYGYYLDSSTLAGVKVLVIVCSQGTSVDGSVNIPYTSDEVKSVVRFVQNGGGLFLIGDHTTFPPAIFPIANQFGITYGQKLLHDPDDYLQNYSSGEPAEGDVFIVFGRDNFNNHPIMDNITRIELYRTDIFTGLPPDAQPLIISDNDTYYIEDNDRVASPRSVVSAAIPSNGTAGAGRIVAVADTNTFETDENRDSEDTDMDLFDSDNDQYGLQIVEWLADVPEHFGVELASAEKDSLGQGSIIHNCSAGTNTTFYIKVSNAGNMVDTYDLSAADASYKGWSSSLSLSSQMLNSADARIFTLNVRVPPDAQVGDSARFQLEARSRHDPLVTARLNCTVDLPALHNITLTCAENRKNVRSGETATYSLLLANRGNVREKVVLETSGPPGWASSLDIASAEMAPISNRTLTLTVAPPPGALGGTEAKVVATAALDDAPEVRAGADTFTKVIQAFGLRLYCPDPVQGVDPGSLVSFPVLVSNTGNGDDEISLSLVGGSRWSTYLDPSHFFLPYNSTVQAAVVARAPSAAPAGESLALELLGASVREPSARANLSLNAAVNRLGKFRLDIEPYSRSGDPGSVAEFDLTVTNIGNAPENVLLSVDGPALLSKSQVAVAPGDNEVLGLSYPIGAGEPAWAEHFVKVNGTSAFNASIRAGAVAVVVVNQVHRIRGELTPDRLVILPGEEGNCSLTVHNEGNGPEVVTTVLEQLPPGWRSTLEHAQMHLETRGRTEGRVGIGVPAGTPAGMYNLSVNLSDGAGQGLLLGLNVEVLRVLDFTASVQPAVRPAAAGRLARFTLLLDNLGNSAEEIRLSPGGNRPSWISPAEGMTLLNRSGGREVELRVRSSPDAMPGKYRLSIIAVGEANETREVVFYLNVKEASTSTGDLPCILGALLIAAASAAAYLVRRRMRRAQEELDELESATGAGRAAGAAEREEGKGEGAAAAADAEEPPLITRNG